MHTLLTLSSVSPANSPLSAPADDDTKDVALLTTAHEAVSAAYLDCAYASFSAFTKLLSTISKGWPPSPKGLDPDLLPYYKIHHELSVKDNYVF